MKNVLAPRRALTTLAPHQILRPVIGLDIDGTLGEWHGAFIDFCERYLQRPVNGEWDGSVPFWRSLGVSKTTYRQLKLAFRQSGLKRAMRPLPGATELTRTVRAAGAEVWVCTTRPYLRLDNIDPDTRWWLRHHGMQFDGVLFGERKYRDLITLVGSGRVVGVLDDLDEQVEAAWRLGLPAYLLDKKYNSYRALPMHVSDLHEARSQMVINIQEWLKEHDVTAK